MTTALRALNGAALAATKSEVPDPIAGLIENRLASNVVMRVGRVLVDIPEAARLLGANDETALVWLCAGAPYVSAGNWSSGIGFTIDVRMLIDRIFAVTAHLAHISRDDLHEALRLPGSTASL